MQRLRPIGYTYLFSSNKANSGLVVLIVDFKLSFINNDASTAILYRLCRRLVTTRGSYGSRQSHR